MVGPLKFTRTLPLSSDFFYESALIIELEYGVIAETGNIDHPGFAGGNPLGSE